MNTCKTCRFRGHKQTSWRNEPDAYECKTISQGVFPSVEFTEGRARSTDIEGLSSLLVTESFGCTLHEPTENDDGPQPEGKGDRRSGFA